MDEFDGLNPFDNEFGPDAETPPPLGEEESDDELGDEVQETTTRKAPVKTPFPPNTHESTDLGTIKQLITKYKDDPNYRVKSKTSKFQGYSVEDLKRARDEILRQRASYNSQRKAS